MTIFQKNLTEKLPNVELRFDEPMSRHTSFRIGGPVAVMAFPKSGEELAEILKVSALMDIKPAILGAGTNVLAPDEGIDGLVVCLKDCMGGMEQLDETTIRVAAGVTMTRAAMFAANLGLGGMEFAHGIPGTIGGGVYMNAGAYGGEIKDICTFVDVMDKDGNITRRSAEEMKFSYRHSVLEDEGGIVLAAEFKLTPASPEDVKAKMKELQAKRSASQPLDLPSAGSAFKRPVGGFAAALIDQAGLKGYTVGGAGISTKHAGFAVNVGGATAADVRNLLSQVSDIVFEKSGIRLEPEVR
ncbi:MAG: UDP-N-acetylmuramate dehydrogenase, partial [Oscillospiraceae bacterium]|nr:UDP-N-acetylmuramate dehydrogenase [Oscillospiraceae bacterium]